MRPHPIFNISSGWNVIRSEYGIAYYDKQLEGKLLKIQKFFDKRFNISITFRLDSCHYKNPSERFTFGGRNDSPCKFYMVVGSLIEHGKKKNPILIEGIDGVITIEDAINLVG